MYGKKMELVRTRLSFTVIVKHNHFNNPKVAKDNQVSLRESRV